MNAAVTIGEFSRLTHLSVKALRHYHDIDLLAPAAVDPATGYRRYATDQVHTAQLISRLRSLRMPLPDIRAVILTVDAEQRAELLRRHLQRMEDELDRTRQVVASLRGLLTPAPAAFQVEVRDSPALDVLAVLAEVRRDDVYEFCGAAVSALCEAVGSAGLGLAGPLGATYAEQFFTEDRGQVMVYAPLPAGTPPAPELQRGDLRRAVLPGERHAVAVHAGPYLDFDRTYGALGGYVAEHHVPEPRPIREIYLIGPGDVADPDDYRTEVCWPIAADA